MSTRPILVVFGALWALWSCGTGPARYQLARPELFDNAGATDRHCVFDDEAPTWQPGRLTALTCSAWSRRGDFDAVPGQWLFFPNLALGSTTRGISRCPDCQLTVERPKSGTWRIALRAGDDTTALVRYSGHVAEGLFEGQGTLDLQRSESCTGYCKDTFVAEGKLADHITLRGRFTAGVLNAPFELEYTIAEDGIEYAGQGRHDPVRGVRPHGEGRHSAADGTVRSGTWRDGRLHGQGKVRWADGTTYDGAFHAGAFHGQGTFVRHDGARYEGQFEHGKRHGKGTQSTPDGTRYIGEFVHDQRQGEGTLHTPDGAIYTGRFLHGRRHGEGQQKNPDGSTYEGEWRANQRHGAGRFTNADGVTHAGQWIADQLQPDDVQITWASGPYLSYTGPLQDGRPHGAGNLHWRDGLEYVGEFLHGRMAGVGALRWPDEHEYIGQWAEGRPEGCGLHRGPGDVHWVGTWVDGVPEALGCRAVPTEHGPSVADPGRLPLSDLFTALKTQSRRAARKAAKRALPAIRARHLVADLSRSPKQSRRVILGFSWSQGPLRRLVHPSCMPADALTVRAGRDALAARLTGLLDVEAVVDLPVGSTQQVCVDFEGPCGASQGCTSVDVPSGANREPVFARILLERPATP